MTATLSPLFSWRGAIFSKGSGLSPNARLVAAALSMHMSERGDSCFPKLNTLADETGLARSTVQKMLCELAEKGWISKEADYRRDGGQTSNQYTATFPANIEPPRPPARQTGSPRPGDGLPPARETGAKESVMLRATPESENRVVDSATSSPACLPGIEPSATPTARPTIDQGFLDFWQEYPRKVGKTEAAKAWSKLNGHAVEVLPGLMPWKRYWEARGEPQFIPHPATFLNKERWSDPPPQLTAPPGGPRCETNPFIELYWEARNEH